MYATLVRNLRIAHRTSFPPAPRAFSFPEQLVHVAVKERSDAHVGGGAVAGRAHSVIYGASLNYTHNQHTNHPQHGSSNTNNNLAGMAR